MEKQQPPIPGTFSIIIPNTSTENLTQTASNQPVSKLVEKNDKKTADQDEVIVENMIPRKKKMSPREAMKILGI